MIIELSHYTVPDENVIAYKSLYMIEVGLREFIIQSLSSIDRLWWKHLLPPDLVTKVKDGRTTEKKIKWTDLTPHHPLYYIDFPDLKKIIDKNDNWKMIFQGYFSDKEVFDGTLKVLEPIRNKVAHNRKVSKTELLVVSSSLELLMTCIGESRYRELLGKQTAANDIPGYLNGLLTLAKGNYDCIRKMESLNSLDLWLEVKGSWWFDEDYLNHDLTAINYFFQLFLDYSAFPRTRGSGYLIETWLTRNNLENAEIEAIIALTNLLNGDK